MEFYYRRVYQSQLVTDHSVILLILEKFGENQFFQITQSVKDSRQTENIYHVITTKKLNGENGHRQ